MSESDSKWIHEWLGIPATETEPSHYQLLGLAELEPDPNVISFVSTWRIDFVRSRQSGAAAAQATALIKRLQAAKVVLLNPQQKAAYDSRHRAANPGMVAPPAASPADGTRQWLGIVVGPTQELSDRRLLGITDDEDSPAVLQSQFDQRMTVLRNLEKALTDDEQRRAQLLVSQLALAHSRVSKSLAAFESPSSDQAADSPAGDQADASAAADQADDSELPAAPQRMKPIRRATNVDSAVKASAAQAPPISLTDRLRSGTLPAQPLGSALQTALLVAFVGGLSAATFFLLGRWSSSQPAGTAVEPAASSAAEPASTAEQLSDPSIPYPDLVDGFYGWEPQGGAERFRRTKDAGEWIMSTLGDLGDRNTGRLKRSFQVPADARQLNFDLQGGGSRKVYVSLSRGQTVVERATGKNNVAFFPVSWDISRYRRQTLTIEIVDEAESRWGWIGVKNFHLTGPRPSGNPAPVLPMVKGELPAPPLNAPETPASETPIPESPIPGTPTPDEPVVDKPTPGTRIAEKPGRVSPIQNPTFADGLKGWRLDGGARGFGRSQSPDGDWVLSTYGVDRENDLGAISQSFVVPEWATALEFWIAGGSEQSVSVLLIDGSMAEGQRRGDILKQARGRDSHEFQLIRWDLVELRGRTVTLMIGDAIHGQRWGWISVKNLQVIDSTHSTDDSDLAAESADSAALDVVDAKPVSRDSSTQEQPTEAVVGLINPDFAAGLTGWKIVNRGDNFRTFRDADRWTMSTRGGLADSSGGAVTQTFQVPANAVSLRFEMTGGDSARANVRLSRGNQTIEREVGQNDGRWREVTWDLTRYRGQEVTVTISDTAIGMSGYVEVRDFRLITAPIDPDP